MKIYGCKIAPDDPRDLPFRAPTRVRIPDAVDFRPQCSPVENQQELSSCVANAVAGALEYMDRRAQVPLVDYSRLYIYYHARALQGWQDLDDGCYIRDAMKVAAKRGVCSEKLWPYQQDRVNIPPAARAEKQARTRVVERYSRTRTLGDMLIALALGYPIVAGFPVYPALEGDAVAGGQPLPAPVAGEKENGYHAMMIAGYHLPGRTLLVRNSWGRDWGEGGYCRVPFSYAEMGLIEDAWAVQARA